VKAEKLEKRDDLTALTALKSSKRAGNEKCPIHYASWEATSLGTRTRPLAPRVVGLLDFWLRQARSIG